MACIAIVPFSNGAIVGYIVAIWVANPCSNRQWLKIIANTIRIVAAFLYVRPILANL